MLNQVGEVKVKVVEAFITTPKYPLKEEERMAMNNRGEAIHVSNSIAIKVEAADGSSDILFLEFSNRDGFGNNSDKVRWELTLEDLSYLLQEELTTTLDLQTKLIQKDGGVYLPVKLNEIVVFTKETESGNKTYNNVSYIVKSSATKVDPSQIDMTMFAFGQPAQATATQPAVAQTPTAPAAQGGFFNTMTIPEPPK